MSLVWAPTALKARVDAAAADFSFVSHYLQCTQSAKLRFGHYLKANICGLAIAFKAQWPGPFCQRLWLWPWAKLVWHKLSCLKYDFSRWLSKKKLQKAVNHSVVSYMLISGLEPNSAGPYPQGSFLCWFDWFRRKFLLSIPVQAIACVWLRGH